MKTTIKPRHAAQMQNMPLAVQSGACGFRLVHVCDGGGLGKHSQTTVLAQDRIGDVPVWFSDPQEAYRIMREAQGVTAAMLATVFGGVK